ncbi:MAG TPA: S-adenosylmethionine:tRNA ribosyltransferase-isomerase, partial [Bacteroidales bacterium]|nr:S-adenosylmethionine:tRNA ribosyltransferase-isomerase [Bacteroidales bacterium]
VFNRSKVVPARLLFQKETGAIIEIFCLEPAFPPEYNLAFLQENSCTWYCTVGNVKKWKTKPLFLHNPDNNPAIQDMKLQAFLLGQDADRYLVRFDWQNGVSFSSVLETAGKVPIPPYLKRQAEPSDTERYQTVYARDRGSVAAPTAGLHFSDALMDEMGKKGIATAFLSLHVGAGTFKPVKAQDIRDHTMHSEPFCVPVRFIRQLISHNGPLVSVGTTTCRCLESLYYLGLQVAAGKDPLFVGQWEPYVTPGKISYKESLTHLLAYAEKNEKESIEAATQIIMAPGFLFRSTDVLITNFHQPNSTLLLLVSALIGERWKDVYAHALAHQYRFLSYGDSCMFFNPK